MQVRHLMSAPVITAHPDMSLKEIIDLLNTNDISGVPVIDADGKMIGMISWSELFPRIRMIGRPAVHIPVFFREIVDLKNTVESYKESAHLTAKDIMNSLPVFVDVEDNIGEVVWTMVQDDLYMVPVLEGGTLAGILTRRDFVRFLAQEL